MTQLRLESVSKACPHRRATRPAVSDVSFEVCAPEFMAIYAGPRSGKSTLLRIAAGIEAPDSGSVRYNGRDIASMSERELAEYRLRTAGWVSDGRPSLAGFRAVDYVAAPALATGADGRMAAGSAHQALREVDADYCSDAWLHELSESERVRIQLARALIRRPRILLADEPAASLGVMEKRAMLRLLRELAHEQDMAVVVTASDLSELLGVTRIVRLISDGGVVDHEPAAPPLGQLVDFPGRRRSSDA
jgi:ABC-type lipoprotein export system ATPase subunit